jgi:hypothetical protein
LARAGEVRFWLPIGTYVIDYYFGTLTFSNQKYHPDPIVIDGLSEAKLYQWETYLMAFGQQRRSSSFGGGGGGQRKDFTSVRLTGLFATKKPGLLVGTVEGESLDQLIEKIKECVAKKAGLTLFIREVDQPKGNYVAQIFADVDNRPAQGARPAYEKSIQPDPTPKPDTASYDPFGPRR